MTDHPCKGRSQAQIEAFEQIAIGQPPRCSPRTLAALERDGLIVKSGNRVLGRDGFGAITVDFYEVPIPHHMQWCQWCSEQPESDDENPI